MLVVLVVHIVAASIGLLTGYVALFAAKGGSLHRRSGMLFVAAMLAMCAAGAALALIRGIWVVVNVPAAMLTAYLVFTGLTTVRPLPVGSRWPHVALMLAILAMSVVELRLGVLTVVSGGNGEGIPAFPFFMFGGVGLVAALGDARMMRGATVLRGAPRLARHLWRMTFALFIAAMSFFLGQAKVIPKPIRIPALLAIPPLVALATMLYWLWRVRARRGARARVALPSSAHHPLRPLDMFRRDSRST